LQNNWGPEILTGIANIVIPETQTPEIFAGTVELRRDLLPYMKQKISWKDRPPEVLHRLEQQIQMDGLGWQKVIETAEPLQLHLQENLISLSNIVGLL